MLITCDGCNTKMRVADTVAGKRVKCPKCGTILSVPKAETPKEEEPTPIAPVENDGTEGTASSVSTKPPPLPAKAAKTNRDDDDEEDDDRPSRKKRRRDDDDDSDEHDVDPGRGLRQESIGMSLTSMILGIVSLVILLLFAFGGGLLMLCCCPFLAAAGPFVGTAAASLPAILALILGLVGMGQGGKGYALTGMILGGVTLILGITLIVLSLVFGVALFGAAAAMPPPQPGPPPQIRFGP